MDQEGAIRSCVFLESKTEGNAIQLPALKKEGFWSRLRGFIGKHDGRVFLFERCSSIHTMCMTHAIDVAFLSKKGEVMKVLINMQPWTFASCFGAYATIERLHSDKPWFVQNEFVTFENTTNNKRKERIAWQPSAS